MIATDLVSGVGAISVPIAHVLGVLTPAHVVIVAFLTQTAFVFFDAANFGFLPTLVGRAQVLPANSLLSSLGSAAETAGPVAAGALMAMMAPPVLVGFDALSFFTSAVILRRAFPPGSAAREDTDASGGMLSRSLEGFHYVAKNRTVGVSTGVSALLTVARGALVALLVVWAQQAFGIRRGDPRLGILFGTLAVAGVAAGLVAAGVGRRFGPSLAVKILVPAGTAAAYMTLAVSSWVVAAALLVVAMTCNTAAVVTVISLRQQVTPARLQSRVNTTARMIAFGACYATGAMAAGTLAERLGVVTAMRMLFAVLVIATLVAWTGLRAPVRQDDRAQPAAVSIPEGSR
jgi:Transmembrane secretion effector